MGLSKLRKDIDKIDKAIMVLLKKRLDVVKKIGVYKNKNNLKVVDKNREQELLNSKKVLAKKLKLDEKYAVDLFKRIIKESYNIERNIIKK